MRHLYRKCFEHSHEAEETAKGFVMFPVAPAVGDVEVSVSECDGKHCVNIAFEGEFDAQELFAATGYQRVA